MSKVANSPAHLIMDTSICMEGFLNIYLVEVLFYIFSVARIITARDASHSLEPMSLCLQINTNFKFKCGY